MDIKKDEKDIIYFIELLSGKELQLWYRELLKAILANAKGGRRRF